MRKAYSLAFRTKMVERMTGPNAITASRLAKGTGVTQQTLSRWLLEADNLPLMQHLKKIGKLTVDDKIRILTECSKLEGHALGEFLRATGVHPSQLESWKTALDCEQTTSKTTAKKIRELERELRRKEKALAEAAALLVLKKKAEEWMDDEDENTT